MKLIRDKRADIVMLEAGDIYRAGKEFGLIPIMAEVYNLGTPDYYAVAVVKIRDNSSELIYLKRKNSCHTGLGQVLGCPCIHHNITPDISGSRVDNPDVVVDSE